MEWRRSTRWVLLTAVVAAAALPLLFGASAAAADTATSNCTRTCGKVDIPYPFGVEPSCYLPGLNVTCRNSGSRGQGPPLQLFLGDGTVQVLEISVPNGTVRINSSGGVDLPGASGGAATAAAGGALAKYGPYSLLPVVLEWSVIHSTCYANASSPACRSRHSHCENTTASGWHLCHCDKGYQGNPYIPNGCKDVNECDFPEMYPCPFKCNNTEGSYQCLCLPGFSGSMQNGCKDIDECMHPDIYPCYGVCKNLVGNYSCQCAEGTAGDPFTLPGCIVPPKRASVTFRNAILYGVLILLLLALGVPILLRTVKLHKVKKLKEKYFKQNHGLLLQQLISWKSDIGERMIITLEELEKATDKFDASYEIGGGGHGVVYKGLLHLQVVAIKKSRIVVQREIDDFINEVAILSQINHRNVVKLLGCCLETEVPLLVYEFISNGTLSQHLHVDGPKSLSWDDRLRIAFEISKALAYLHSAASTPILHRDIKSSNVLLDDALTAKVSDFGASKYIPIDRTGVTTAVQGTIGYLDPKYYNTGPLTDKSDVFSFGVLLIELLTRKKPFLYPLDDGEGLVSHFASLLSQGTLIVIIDPQIIEEEGEAVDEVAALAAKCTKLSGEDRPTMREVEMTLENLRGTKKQVHHNTTSRRRYEKGHNMSLGGLPQETSRQYSMEEEILLTPLWTEKDVAFYIH